MRRRELIALLGGVMAWPAVVCAQQPGPVRRIGVLQSLSETDPEGQDRIAALRQGLHALR